MKIGRQWRFREGEVREWLRSPNSEKMKYHSEIRSTAAAV
jgi:hypothetical protein